MAGNMTIVALVFTLVVYSTAVAGQDLGVSDAMAARVDAQAWRVDRLTTQFQAISDRADEARTAAKIGGARSRHLTNYFMLDNECRPNTRRCGKSAQCISVMAFCDGVNDCKNHYDENPERCVMPFEVNSTWRCFPVYDNCWKIRATEVSLTVLSITSNKVYKVHEKMTALAYVEVNKGGYRMRVARHQHGYYDHGTQSLVIRANVDQQVHTIWHFDGILTDRYTHSLYYKTSGDKCAEYRAIKQ